MVFEIICSSWKKQHGKQRAAFQRTTTPITETQKQGAPCDALPRALLAEAHPGAINKHLWSLHMGLTQAAPPVIVAACTQIDAATLHLSIDGSNTGGGGGG